jgi:hypothetical protein
LLQLSLEYYEKDIFFGQRKYNTPTPIFKIITEENDEQSLFSRKILKRMKI